MMRSMLLENWRRHRVTVANRLTAPAQVAEGLGLAHLAALPGIVAEPFGEPALRRWLASSNVRA